MRADEGVKIKYSSKFASTANYWKKWIGESQGLVATGAVAKKRANEKLFNDRVNDKRKWKKEYGTLISDFEKAYKDIEALAYARDYYNETFSRNIEIFRLKNNIQRLVDAYENNGESGYNNFKSRLIPYLQNFYKNYDSDIDQDVMAALLELYIENVDAEFIPESVFEYTIGYDQIAEELFGNTSLNSMEKMMSILEMEPSKAVQKLNADPIMKLGGEWKKVYDEKIAGPYNTQNEKINTLQKKYMAALMEVFSEKSFWPDANSTMRVTYGQVEGYNPKDGVYYLPVSYLEGVMEQYKPGDYEFDVSKKLLDLYKSKDYGSYTDKNGKVPVCFLGSNHTTGGNSGSPAIDANGNLIGLNFDRVWEGTMSDYNYDRSICRNIMVDIRYILFIVDKYAGASHLIEEMKLVHPKK